MRKIYLIFICCVLTYGCYPVRPLLVSAVAVDYKKYSSDNFFVTESNTAQKEYSPLGSITALAMSGTIGNYKTKFVDDVYGGKDDSSIDYSDIHGLEQIESTSSNKYIRVTAQTAVDLLYKKAKDIGANGIINLKITYIPSYSLSSGNISDGYSATGMAVTIINK